MSCCGTTMRMVRFSPWLHVAEQLAALHVATRQVRHRAPARARPARRATTACRPSSSSTRSRLARSASSASRASAAFTWSVNMHARQLRLRRLDRAPPAPRRPIASSRWRRVSTVCPAVTAVPGTQAYLLDEPARPRAQLRVLRRPHHALGHHAVRRRHRNSTTASAASAPPVSVTARSRRCDSDAEDSTCCAPLTRGHSRPCTERPDRQRNANEEEAVGEKQRDRHHHDQPVRARQRLVEREPGPLAGGEQHAAGAPWHGTACDRTTRRGSASSAPRGSGSRAGR